MSIRQRAALVSLLGCTIAAAAIAFAAWSRLFSATPDGAGRLVRASCTSSSPAACRVTLLELGPGRYWAEASAGDAHDLAFDFDLPARPASVVLLPARSDDLTVTAWTPTTGPAGPGWTTVPAERVPGGFRRGLLRLTPPVGGPLRVTVSRVAEGSARFRLEEIGAFASDRALLSDDRGFMASLPDRRVYQGVLSRACLALAALGSVATFLLPAPIARRAAVFLALAVTLAAVTLELWIAHSPYWFGARDLAVSLASGPVQEGVGSNLNYGMHLGSRLLLGEGLTFGPGRVPWERMPGYGFFGALAGLVAGYRTDLLTIGLHSIRLQLLALALAAAAFVAGASRLVRPAVALVAALLVAFMPNQLANAQADSIMVPVYLLSAAALCRYLDRSRQGSAAPLVDHLLVHSSFALWFLMRPDGVIGWAAVSLVLYWRRPRFLVLPAALFLAIGLSWGAYKYRYTGEFSITTNTVGDTAWIGLWQVPNRFRWHTKDESYFTWAREIGVPATSKRGSDTALREVARFAATYPVYVAHLALHRLLRFVDQDAFDGLIVYPHLAYGRLHGPAVFALIVAVVLALAFGPERLRTLLLAWPLLFSLPLFLLFFSDDMRHVAPVSASLLVVGACVALDPDFYRAVWRERRGAFGVMAMLVLAWLGAQRLDRALLASDAWRYWTPFLDPAPFAWYLR